MCIWKYVYKYAHIRTHIRTDTYTDTYTDAHTAIRTPIRPYGRPYGHTDTYAVHTDTCADHTDGPARMLNPRRNIQNRAFPHACIPFVCFYVKSLDVGRVLTKMEQNDPKLENIIIIMVSP